jgi:helicase MOV-10
MCRSQEYLDHHLSSRKHKAAVAAAKDRTDRKQEYIPRKCIICNVRLMLPGNINEHLKGNAHAVRLSAVRKQGTLVNPAQVIVEDKQSTLECAICETTIWNQDRARHQRSARHRQKERFMSIKAALEEAEKDKYGVSVTSKDGFDFGLMDVARATREFYVKLDNTKSGVHIRSARIASSSKRQSW